MTPVVDLLARAAYDPLVRSALLAGAVLLVAALVSGASRRDAVALTRASTWLAVAAALLSALGLSAASSAWGPLGSAPFVAVGWERLPLYLLAIGYGPTVGAVAGLAVAMVVSGPLGFTANDLALVLELTVAGWLALGPSPRRVRWAGPMAALLGWALATATVDLAGWAADGRPIEPGPFLSDHAAGTIGVVAAALVAATVPPAWWRRRVPGAADGVRAERDDERVRYLVPLRRPDRPKRARRSTRWARPLQPASMRRGTRRMAGARASRTMDPVVLPPGLVRPGTSEDPPS